MFQAMGVSPVEYYNELFDRRVDVIVVDANSKFWEYSNKYVTTWEYTFSHYLEVTIRSIVWRDVISFFDKNQVIVGQDRGTHLTFS